MNYTFENALVYENGSFVRKSVSVCNGVLSSAADLRDTKVISASHYAILPGFVDVHVHFREPGFSYKETIASGSLAAAHGGYSAVCTMPNLNPAPDTLEHLREELDIIEKDAVIQVLPYGTITQGEKGEVLSDMEKMAPYVCAFSDDGRGVQNRDMMRVAMVEAKKLGKMIVAHCEDNDLLHGGYIHDGEYAKTHGHKGICSESEWGPIARDIELSSETGCAYHVCHISTKESVSIIREAKKNGVDITCETGPHYLLMNDMMLQEDGRFKMNPPIRSEEDRLALLEGIQDGTIDMIITDHAPHSAEEKGRGLPGSAMGVVGLETCFPVLYTGLVKTGIISLEKLTSLMHHRPCERFCIDAPMENNFTIFDLDSEYTVQPEDFLSQGKSSPFTGWTVNGKCMMTVSNGNIAYCDASLFE